MNRTALYPGSFDPITTGHVHIVERALPLFDHIVVAIGSNTQKKCRFPLEQRLRWIEAAFSQYKNVEVATYEGLTTDFCHEHHIGYLLRGVRSTTDYAYEEQLGAINRLIAPNVETVILMAAPEYTAISSTMVRELLAFGHDVRAYLPPAIRNEFD